MTLEEHLADLRKTLIRVVFILAASFMLCYSQGEVIQEFLLVPLRNSLEKFGQGEVVFLEILDKVLAQFQVAFWSSVIVSAPLWFFQVWAFVKPALYDKEVKVIRPFIFVGFLLFATGVCFGYYVVFPLTFQTLLNFGVQDATAQMSLKGYLVLSCKVLVFLGILFQLPNVLLILGYMGLVTKQSLSAMRRYIYVAFAVISAMLTPPDVVTLLGLWVPMVVLYELGILGVALLVHPWLHKKTAEEDEAEKEKSQNITESPDPDKE